MPHFDSLLEETLEAWSDVRQGLLEELENIPDDRFDFRPTPEVRSVAELTQHILEVALMMTGELTRPDTDFRRAPWPELLDLYAAHVKKATDRAVGRVVPRSGTEVPRGRGAAHTAADRAVRWRERDAAGVAEPRDRAGDVPSRPDRHL